MKAKIDELKAEYREMKDEIDREIEEEGPGPWTKTDITRVVGVYVLFGLMAPVLGPIMLIDYLFRPGWILPCK